jgi:CBS domain-containing protein
VRQYLDFLGAQPPYDVLDSAELERLVRHLEVEYAPKGTVIVRAGEEALDHIYVVRKGVVEVVDRGRVIDELGPGDTFGHISVLSGLPPPLAVRAAEDTLLYRLPDPRPLVDDPERLHFRNYGSLVARGRVTRDSVADAAQRPVQQYMRPAIWAEPGDTIRDTASRITAERQSCALVHTAGGVGIVTDSDFRRAFTTGSVDGSSRVAEIATSPARTVPAETSRSQAFVLMIEHDVHHLVVVDPLGRPIGIVRAIDIASADVRDPLLIRAAIESATSVAQLVDAATLMPSTAMELVDAALPVGRIGRLLSAVRDAMLRKVIELDEQPGDVVCSWFVLGSTARFEPLPSSDLDTALAWDDPASTATPVGPVARRAAAQVLSDIERCGLRRCPDGNNATNPQFSRSVREWADVAARWQRDPTGDQALLLTSMAADSRPVTGISVGREVSTHTRASRPSREYLATMLRYAVAVKPPVGFVRGFVVEHTGEHRGQLDLKKRGLVPIASIGRWVTVVTGGPPASTPDRLVRGRDAGVLTSDEYESLRGAFELIYELLLQRDVDAVRHERPPSRYIDPDDLDTLTRRSLRNVFREVQRVQSRLESEWVSRLP